MTTDDKTAQWQVTCICGWRVQGIKPHVVASVQAHGSSAHGQEPTEEQVLQQATLVGS